GCTRGVVGTGGRRHRGHCWSGGGSGAFDASEVGRLVGALDDVFGDQPDAGGVLLVLEDLGLEPGAFGYDDDVVVAARGRRARLARLDDAAAVLGHAFSVLLAVRVADRGARGHDDAGIGTVLAGLPGAFGRHHSAPRVELAGVFPEVPDAAGFVLG